MISRRSFLEGSSLALATLACLPAVASSTKSGPLGKAIGIQLYTVRNETKQDLLGTLKSLSDIGFREVEMAGYYGKSAKELRSMLTDLSLQPTSAHQGMTDLLQDTQKKLDYVAELGVKYLIVPSPAVPDNRFANLPQGSGKNIWNSMTLDDWKWMAEELNKLGEIGKKSGITVGYHNHNSEFRVFDGVVAFDELLRRTDPTLVTMELDIAWVVVAGHDPVKYLTEHAERISLLHVKDVKKDVKTIIDQPMTTTTEVGSGKVDWNRLFAACSRRYLDRYYYEQEQWDGPVIEAAKKSFDYLSTLKA